MEVVDEVSNLLCMACLCVGRTIRRITDETLKQYYMAILNEIPLCITPQVVPFVCWECDAVLKKILTFKEQVKDSYRILQTYTKENLCEYLLSEVGRPPRLKVHNNECVVITPDEDFLLDTKLIEDSKQEIAEIETVICDGKLDFEKCPINEVRRKIKSSHTEAATDCLEVKTEKQEDFQTSEEPKVEEFATVMCDVQRQENRRKDLKVECNGSLDVKYKVDKSSADTEESDGASYNNDVLNEENGLASDCDSEKPTTKVKVKKKRDSRTKTKVVKNKNTEKDPASDKYKTVTLSYEELHGERTVRARRTEYVCAAHACRSCMRVFPSAAARAQHDTTKHAPELGEYICPICYTVLATVDAFTAHYKRHIRRYECSTCQKRTAAVKAMERHISTHAHTHKTKKAELVRARAARGAGGRVACGACDKTFSHRAGLMNHRLAVHEAQNVFPCGACDKVFRWKTSLKRHLEKHNDKSEGGTAAGGGASAGGGAGAAYCDACELTFASVCSLQRHLRNSLKHVTQDQLKYVHLRALQQAVRGQDEAAEPHRGETSTLDVHLQPLRQAFEEPRGSGAARPQRAQGPTQQQDLPPLREGLPYEDAAGVAHPHAHRRAALHLRVLPHHLLPAVQPVQAPPPGASEHKVEEISSGQEEKRRERAAGAASVLRQHARSVIALELRGLSDHRC